MLRVYVETAFVTYVPIYVIKEVINVVPRYY